MGKDFLTCPIVRIYIFTLCFA